MFDYEKKLARFESTGPFVAGQITQVHLDDHFHERTEIFPRFINYT